MPTPRPVLAALTALCLALPACNRAEPEAETPSAAQAPTPQAEDAPAPEASAAQAPTTLPTTDVQGLQQIIAQADADDQILVLDFWATWCVPCIQIFPALHEGLHAMGDKVRPVTITLDGPDRIPQAIDFLQRHHALTDAYRLPPDSDAQLAVVEALGEDWNDLVVPAILVFNPRGELAGEFVGGDQAQPILDRVREMTQAEAQQARP